MIRNFFKRPPRQSGLTCRATQALLAGLLLAGSIQAQLADQPYSLEDLVSSYGHAYRGAYTFNLFTGCMPIYFPGATMWGLSDEDRGRVSEAVGRILPVVESDDDSELPRLDVWGRPEPRWSYWIEFTFSKRLYDPLSDTYRYMPVYERSVSIPYIRVDDIAEAVTSAAEEFMEDYRVVNFEEDCA